MKTQAWLLADYPPGSGAHYMDVFTYNLKTLQPQVGPVIAEWMIRYGHCPKFKIVFTVDGRLPGR